MAGGPAGARGSSGVTAASRPQLRFGPAEHRGGVIERAPHEPCSHRRPLRARRDAALLDGAVADRKSALAQKWPDISASEAYRRDHGYTSGNNWNRRAP